MRVALGLLELVEQDIDTYMFEVLRFYRTFSSDEFRTDDVKR